MTHKEIAASLLELANVYETTPDDAGISDMGGKVSLYATTKTQVIATIKVIGGKFIKRGDDDYFMYYDSVRIPGVYIYVERSVVCRKIPARYECDPLLSPEDEAEIMAVSA